MFFVLLLFYHTLLYSIPFWVYFQFCYLYHLWPIFMLFICFSSFCYFSFYSCCLYYKSCSFRLVNSLSVRLSFRPSVEALGKITNCVIKASIPSGYSFHNHWNQTKVNLQNNIIWNGNTDVESGESQLIHSIPGIENHRCTVDWDEQFFFVSSGNSLCQTPSTHCGSRWNEFRKIM